IAVAEQIQAIQPLDAGLQATGQEAKLVVAEDGAVEKVKGTSSRVIVSLGELLKQQAPLMLDSRGVEQGMVEHIGEQIERHVKVFRRHQDREIEELPAHSEADLPAAGGHCPQNGIPVWPGRRALQVHPLEE